MKELGHSWELFGFSKEAFLVVEKRFKHALVEDDNFVTLAKTLDLENGGELAVLAYLVGRLIERNERPNLMSMIKGDRNDN